MTNQVERFYFHTALKKELSMNSAIPVTSSIHHHQILPLMFDVLRQVCAFPQTSISVDLCDRMYGMTAVGKLYCSETVSYYRTRVI